MYFIFFSSYSRAITNAENDDKFVTVVQFIDIVRKHKYFEFNYETIVRINVFSN